MKDIQSLAAKIEIQIRWGMAEIIYKAAFQAYSIEFPNKNESDFISCVLINCKKSHLKSEELPLDITVKGTTPTLEKLIYKLVMKTVYDSINNNYRIFPEFIDFVQARRYQLNYEHIDKDSLGKKQNTQNKENFEFITLDKLRKIESPKEPEIIFVPVTDKPSSTVKKERNNGSNKPTQGSIALYIYYQQEAGDIPYFESVDEPKLKQINKYAKIFDVSPNRLQILYNKISRYKTDRIAKNQIKNIEGAIKLLNGNQKALDLAKSELEEAKYFGNGFL